MQDSSLFEVITWIAILSMVVGNSLALRQQSIKRILAYSSIAHMGYLLIIVLLGNIESVNLAWQSVLFYLTAYTLANISIFTVMVIESNASENGDVKILDWQGLFWRQPLLASLVIFSVLSFAGIPLTAGFIGKFYLISFATNQELWSLLAALIIGSGIALAYYLPMIFSLFSDSIESETKPKLFNFTLSDKSVVSLFLGAGIILGVFPDLIGQFLQQL